MKNDIRIKNVQNAAWRLGNTSTTRVAPQGQIGLQSDQSRQDTSWRESGGAARGRGQALGSQSRIFQSGSVSNGATINL